jgi:tetratricopeptide (TPR) repeat protein
MKEYVIAVNHLLAARYMVEITGGPRHPVISEILVRLATILEDVGELETALTCLMTARQQKNGVVLLVQVTEQLSSLLFKMGQTEVAIKEQKKAYSLLRDLISDPKDARLLAARNKLEKFFRSSMEEKKLISLQKQTSELMKESEKEASGPVGSGVPLAPSQSEDDGDLDAIGGDALHTEKKKPKKKGKTKK